MQYCFLIQISNQYIKQQVILRPVSGDIRFREYSGTPAWQAWRGVRTRIYSVNPTNTNSSVWTAGTISLRKKNGIVQMKIEGATFAAVSARTAFATIPEEYRPETESYIQDNSGNRYVIRTDGVIQVDPRSAGQTWGAGMWIAVEY